MSYLVLARKYRPRTFAEVIGQDVVTRVLRGALAEGRFGVRVLDSRYNVLSVAGETFIGEECNFEQLGVALFPETYGTDAWRNK